MIISLALVLLVTASGTLASYLYDEDVNFAARLCGGACIGIAALGLVGFVLASFLGLTPLAILLALLIIVLLSLLSLRNPVRRTLVQQNMINSSGVREPHRAAARLHPFLCSRCGNSLARFSTRDD